MADFVRAYRSHNVVVDVPFVAPRHNGAVSLPELLTLPAFTNLEFNSLKISQGALLSAIL